MIRRIRGWRRDRRIRYIGGGAFWYKEVSGGAEPVQAEVTRDGHTYGPHFYLASVSWGLFPVESPGEWGRDTLAPSGEVWRDQEMVGDQYPTFHAAARAAVRWAEHITKEQASNE